MTPRTLDPTAGLRALSAAGLSDTTPAHDAWLDAGHTAAALSQLGGSQPLLLRVAPELDEPTELFGPPPRDPLWMVVRGGSADLDLAPANGGPSRKTRALRVRLAATSEPCCDAPACAAEKLHASLWLDLDVGGAADAPRRVLVAERRADTDDAHGLASLAHALAAATGAPLEHEGLADDADAPAGRPPHGHALPARSLAPLAMRFEGDVLVVREIGSGGPRATARRTGLTGALLALPAAAAWITLARGLGERGTGESLGLFALATLFSLAAYAFVGVARYAARYRADSAPVLAVSGGRFVVRPWVGRDGAVERRADGRFGAAIPIHELRGVATRQRGDVSSVELDTDHGPIDVALLSDPRAAELWSVALRGVLAGAAHRVTGPTAIQRAREKHAPGVQGARPTGR
jgi:hypothetical protein